MRFVLFIILIQLTITAFGQRIDFRNDSLFVDGYNVTGATQKTTLDSLLKTKGKIKKGPGKHIRGSAEITSWKSYTYSSKGIIFSRQDADTTQLSISIKLHKNSNATVDWNNLPTKQFSGSLFIGENYMNDKREVEQLQKLKDCTIIYNHQIALGKIIYQQKSIRLLFDIMTDQATCIFINEK